MKDIQLRANGDLFINASAGDIEITDSIVQAIRVRLLWFFREWRLGSDYGIPYYEDVLVKNPSNLRIRQMFRDSILSVQGVEDVIALTVKTNADRSASVCYTVRIGSTEEISEEVSIYG